MMSRREEINAAEQDKKIERQHLRNLCGTFDAGVLAKLSARLRDFDTVRRDVKTELQKKMTIVENVAQQIQDRIESIQQEKIAGPLTGPAKETMVVNWFKTVWNLKLEEGKSTKNLKKLIEYVTDGLDVDPNSDEHLAREAAKKMPMIINEWLVNMKKL